MQHRVLSTRVSTEPGLALVRDRARQIGALFGLDELQRTRLAMAVSEVARNAVLHAKGGKVEFLLDDAAAPGEPDGQRIAVRIDDLGPGIAQLESVLDGSFRPRGQKSLGLAGSRRLADGFEIASTPAGTGVTLWMQIPRGLPRISAAQLDALVEQLSRRKAQTPAEELEQRHRELLQTLDTLRQCQQELQDAGQRNERFLAKLAHDLRSPLGAIHTTLEYLARRPPAAEAEFTRARQLIERQVQQLSRLVDGLASAPHPAPDAAPEQRPSMAGDAPPLPDDAPPATAAQQAARRILLIDDNVDNVEMLAEVLRLHGQQVMVAPDGIRGLEIARGFLPDAIVVDIGLPVMDGFEVGRALRAEAALGHPYMATLSGYGTEAVRQRSLEAGYDAHFTKPVDVQVLLERVGVLDPGS